MIISPNYNKILVILRTCPDKTTLVTPYGQLSGMAGYIFQPRNQQVHKLQIWCMEVLKMMSLFEKDSLSAS